MISLSNLVSRIKPLRNVGESSNFLASNFLENTFSLPSGNYWNRGFPNPREPSMVLFGSFSNMVTDVCPTTWGKIPRRLGFLNVNTSGGGNTWVANDYSIMLQRYPIDTFFYLTYKGRLFRLRFNSAANAKIRNTSFWHSTDAGSNWSPVSNSTWIDQSPDGQTINGVFVDWNEPFLNMVEVIPPLMDTLSVAARTSCVAAYGTKRLFSNYTGPTIRLIRASDNVQADFFANVIGQMSTGINNTGISFLNWVSGTSANVVTWYDQSGRGRHLNAESTTRAPVITNDSNCLHLGGGINLSCTNVFDTTTVTNMHVVSCTREIARIENTLINFNGTDIGFSRFSMHTPWSDGVYYWDPWGGNIDQRAQSVANITAVNQKAVMSAYKSTTDNNNGFRINQGTLYVSSGIARAATVAGGLRLTGANHYIYNLIVFNNKLPTVDEDLVERNV